MNVVFIVPPEKYYIESYVTKKLDKGREFRQKLGLLYVAGYLREHGGYQPVIIDALADGLDDGDVIKMLLADPPDVVGFSVLTFNLLDCLNIARQIKAVLPAVKICFGGFHPSIYPQETLNFPEVDYIVFGEGEITFNELVKAIEQHDAADLDSLLEGIEGVGWKAQLTGETHINPSRKAVANLDQLSLPAHDLIDLDKYTVVLANDAKVASIQTSRGCPSKCTFCDIRLTRYRYRSAQNILSEIELLKSKGITEFFIIDDTFTINRKRVLALCNLLIDEQVNIKFKISSRIDRVDFEMLSLLKRAGCYRIHYGIETGSQRLLDYLQKEITVEQIKSVVADTKRAGIEIFAYMMVGIPTETEEDINKSIALVADLKPDHVNYSICTPFPKTVLYEQFLNQNLGQEDYWQQFASSPDPDFKIRTINAHFTEEELRVVQDRALRSFYASPVIILRELWKTRSLKQLLTKARTGLRLLMPRRTY